ncbi:hypothetical protein BR10RB9215_C10385 [Brucella sp. 10RB9215]|uniref:hypothetical protein n=1 Tax=Brucella sp. 10RB9215 TaxID=1149953 RepID=UPI00090965B3|nr:hypothetical protein [Brucella sp. 10RB9215]SBW13577.1 hypothetical protein BR10RB9215_C10385 [Brucella sp. 10RB9215]
MIFVQKAVLKIRGIFCSKLQRGIWSASNQPNSTERTRFTWPKISHSGSMETNGSAAARDVLAEHRRQTDAEGFAPEHDDSHSRGEMLTAAWCYMQRHADKDMFGDNYDINKLPPPARWPWSWLWWKPTNRHRDLVKAAALILAEIERLDRLSTPASEGAA